jgi:hypothetical protein
MTFGNNGARHYPANPREGFADDEASLEEDFAGDDGDPHAEIAHLETQIEQLSERLERCRKIRLISLIAIGAGAAWLVAALVGLVPSDMTVLLVAMSAVIGGIVGFGSNTTTTAEVMAAMREAEARRAQLIAMLDLRVVGES